MKEPKLSLKDLGIDGTWAIFLDRDGVINRKVEGDYVREWTQFQFMPSVLEAIRRLSAAFARIIVVTNQRGVARSLIDMADLKDIHKKMIDRIEEAGGRIDGIYICPHDLNDHCNCRKPEIGLALAAKRDFPAIDFTKSVMIGDNESDILFAKALNMKSILIGDHETGRSQEATPNFIFKDLLEFSVSLEHLRAHNPSGGS